MKVVKKENIKKNKKTKQSSSKKLTKTSKTKQKETVKKISRPKGPDLKELEYDIKKDLKNHHHSKKKIILPIICLILLILIFVSLHIITPKIVLNGSNEVIIPYHETYIEEGATSQYFFKDISSKIKTTDNINTNVVGTYEVVYTVKHSFYEIKKIRTVRVVDTKEPIITLEGEKEVNVCPNGNFKEIGYSAIDEYDGDITDKVKVTNSKDKVTYTVKDSSGNEYSISRKINKIDKEKPIITLKGNSTLYLEPGGIFNEPGYTASDNCNDNLTNRVVVTGNVNTQLKGTYTLTYEVSDDYNNKTKIERKVVVSEKTNPSSGVYKKGVIYLTFDDGPSSIITGSILDILKEEGVKATFFVTNNGPDYLIKRMYDEGHTIALHTASHDYSKIYSSVDNYFSDLYSVSNRVKRITGQTSKIIRFPGGSSNTVSRNYSKGIMTSLSNALFSMGYRYYDWNIDSGDASSAKTKDAVYRNVTKNLSQDKVNMVLMHDIKSQTRDALRDIIKYGKNNGYSFERIDMDTYMIRQNIRN